MDDTEHQQRKEMMEPKFANGDIVRLKSGSLPMTILSTQDVAGAGGAVVGNAGWGLMINPQQPAPVGNHRTYTCCYWNQATASFNQWTFAEHALDAVDAQEVM